MEPGDWQNLWRHGGAGGSLASIYHFAECSRGRTWDHHLLIGSPQGLRLRMCMMKAAAWQGEGIPGRPHLSSRLLGEQSGVGGGGGPVGEVRNWFSVSGAGARSGRGWAAQGGRSPRGRCRLLWRLPGPRGCRRRRSPGQCPGWGQARSTGEELRPGGSPLGEQRDGPWLPSSVLPTPMPLIQ